MKVKEIMCSDPATCTPETNLAAAAMLMWDKDCGTLPVVEDGGKVVGMINDRDICMAAATKDRAPAEIAVSEVINNTARTCQPETDIREALRIIGQEQVRRLPVVDREGRLQGILSLSDIVLHAESGADKSKELSAAAILETFKAVCAPHHTQHEQPQQAQGRGA